MKKIYLEPEFELVQIGLVADVLGASTTYEETLPEHGGVGGDDGGFDTDW